MSPRARTDMYSIREILRLSLELNLSGNDIHRTLKISRDVVQKCLKAAKARSIAWPIPEDIDDMTLAAILFEQETDPKKLEFIEPDCHQ